MRLTFDGLVLQAHVCPEEEITIEDIALKVFLHEKDPKKREAAMRFARLRAQRAAQNMILMGQAKPLPNKKEMKAIRVTMSAGGQLAAVMNLTIRQAVLKRKRPVAGQN